MDTVDKVQSPDSIAPNTETTQVDTLRRGHGFPGTLVARGLGPTGRRLSAAGGRSRPPVPAPMSRPSALSGNVKPDRGSAHGSRRSSVPVRHHERAVHASRRAQGRAGGRRRRRASRPARGVRQLERRVPSPVRRALQSRAAACASASSAAPPTRRSTASSPPPSPRSPSPSSSTMRCSAGTRTTSWLNLLAEEVSPNADATVWTVKLRQGVVFHDGSPMTADDVVYSYKRIIDPKNPKMGATQLAALKASGIKKIDANTVRFSARLAQLGLRRGHGRVRQHHRAGRLQPEGSRSGPAPSS